LMTDTYGPATAFITGVRDWQYGAGNPAAVRLKLLFSNVSFVGPNALSDRLKSAGFVQTSDGPKPYSDAVYVSQVVPNYQNDGDDTGDLVQSYRAALGSGGTGPTESFTSLEGYLTARVFIAGLLAHKGRFTPDALIGTFEHLPDLAFGIGSRSGFSANDHQYSKSVWGTAIEGDGSFTDRYYWTEGTPIQPAE